MSWECNSCGASTGRGHQEVEEDWTENLPTTWPAGSSTEVTRSLLVSPGALTCLLLGPSPFIVFRFSGVTRTATLWP